MCERSITVAISLIVALRRWSYIEQWQVWCFVTTVSLMMDGDGFSQCQTFRIIFSQSDSFSNTCLPRMHSDQTQWHNGMVLGCAAARVLLNYLTGFVVWCQVVYFVCSAAAARSWTQTPGAKRAGLLLKWMERAAFSPQCQIWSKGCLPADRDAVWKGRPDHVTHMCAKPKQGR